MTFLLKRYLTVGLLWLSTGPVTLADLERQVSGENQCGPFALHLCCHALAAGRAYSELQEVLPPTGEEYSLAELSMACTDLGLQSRGMRWTAGIPAFKPWTSAAIIPIAIPSGRFHYVVMLASTGDQVLVGDIPGQPVWISVTELRERWKWDGTALHIAKDEAELDRLAAVSAAFPGTNWLLPAVCFLGAFFLWPKPSAAPERHHEAAAATISRGARQAAGLSRSGMTAVELLVSLAVISLLLSLIVPAVQSARERSRNLQCLNNLRQLGNACQQFESAHRHLPAYRGKRKVGERGPVKTNLSVQAQLLPFLDQQTLFDKIDRREDGEGLGSDPPGSGFNADLLRTPVPVFSCPSDSMSHAGNSYRGCIGTTPGVHSTEPESDPGAAQLGIFVRFNGRPLASVKDGLSQTVMFSERLCGDQDTSTFTPSRDVADVSRMPPGHWAFLYPDDVIRACRLITSVDVEHSSFTGFTWLLGGPTDTLYNHVLPPNSAIPDCGYGYRGGNGQGQGAITARSLHPGTVNIVLGDGSARAVNDAIDSDVWRAMGSVRGQEVVDDF